MTPSDDLDAFAAHRPDERCSAILAIVKVMRIDPVMVFTR